MATIKVFLNTRYKSKENTYPIVIRIIDKERIFYHAVGYRVKEDQFKDGQVKDLLLKPGPVNDARNLFLFSYYCKGQRFETCLTLERKNILEGRIYFRSNKGKKYLSVLIHQKLKYLLNNYETQTDFLFPYLKDIPKDPEKYRQKIGSLNVIVNRNLKIVAALAEIKTNQTYGD